MFHRALFLAMAMCLAIALPAFVEAQAFGPGRLFDESSPTFDELTVTGGIALPVDWDDGTKIAIDLSGATGTPGGPDLLIWRSNTIYWNALGDLKGRALIATDNIDTPQIESSDYLDRAGTGAAYGSLGFEFGDVSTAHTDMAGTDHGTIKWREAANRFYARNDSGDADFQCGRLVGTSEIQTAELADANGNACFTLASAGIPSAPNGLAFVSQTLTTPTNPSIQCNASTLFVRIGTGNGNLTASMLTANGAGFRGSAFTDVAGTGPASLSMGHKPKLYSQSAEPDIPNDSAAMWQDSDDSKVYYVFDVGGTQYTVELT